VIDPAGYIYLQGTVSHSFKVGDVISVSQNDNFSANSAFVIYTNPVFKVIEVLNSTTIAINLLAALQSSWSAIGGVARSLEGLVPCQDDDTWGFGGRGANKIWKAYPYLGHLNHPFEPNYDINFGQVRGYYYPDDTTTNNNLFELYWSSFFEECNDLDSRVITAEFDLDAVDISSFRFNDKIFISNQYYRVNKIKDYDPGMRKLTQVELIKAKFLTVPKTVSKSRTPKPNLDTVGPSRDTTIRPVRGFGLVVSNPDNATVKGDVLIGGTKNTVYSNKVAIVGDSNEVSSDNVYIMGNENRVDTISEGVFIIGDKNTINSGVEKSFVFGQGQQVVESRSFVVNGKLVVSADIISACRNEVLNRFPDSKMNNYLSASRNEVRELGSLDIVNIVSGGRFNAEG
jgi:hypothetical protein